MLLGKSSKIFINCVHVHLTGILIGTLTMEMGGKVSIVCPKTGYRCEMEFKLKVKFFNKILV